MAICVADKSEEHAHAFLSASITRTPDVDLTGAAVD